MQSGKTYRQDTTDSVLVFMSGNDVLVPQRHIIKNIGAYSANIGWNGGGCLYVLDPGEKLEFTGVGSEMLVQSAVSGDHTTLVAFLAYEAQPTVTGATLTFQY